MRKKNKEIYVSGLQTIECLLDKLSEKPNHDRELILSECMQYLEILASKIVKSGIQSDMILIDDFQKSIDSIQLVLDDKLNIKELYLSICNLKNKITNISVQYEIVFLPYKASMWDSFDSVYKAALKDEGVNINVIPIPYYSMDKKNETRKLHYEGQMFPQYVEITDYESYDLELEKPDVIFIHNPYDDMNLVTQVAEEYFSSNLIRYTDHLVYIPYDIMQKNKVNINYCLTPGIQNAWRVFLQSDNVREQYMKWYEDKEKFVALGSPKMDAIINAKDVWNTVPQEWKEKCQGKKVIFYNTHLSGIMNNSEVQLNKIQKMYEYFNNHSDVVLLWRPHPLSIQTAEALNPNFLQDYLHMIEKMKMLQNVIYDDTPDMNRSIAISDGYVGDHSSLVLLYALTGKPLLLPSTFGQVLQEGNKELLVSCNGVIVDDYLWTTYDYKNGLFKVNIKTGECELVSEIPNIGLLMESAFSKIIYWKKTLFLIPSSAQYFVKYDIKNNAFTFRECALKDQNKFSTVIQNKNMLYLFSAFYPNPCVSIDLDSFEVKEFEISNKIISQQVLSIDRMLFAIGGECVNDEMWIPFYQTNRVIKIASNKYETFEVKKQSKGIQRIQRDGSVFWILSQSEAEVVCWHERKGVIKRINFREWIKDEQLSSIQDMILYQDVIYFLPRKAMYIIKYDKKNDYVKKISLQQDFVKGFEKCVSQFSSWQIVGVYLYVFQYRSNYMLQLNLMTDIIVAKRIILPKCCEQNWKVKQEFNESSIAVNSKNPEQFLYKDALCTIDNFVEIVKDWKDEQRSIQKAIFSSLNKDTNGQGGKKIWNYIKKHMK